MNSVNWTRQAIRWVLLMLIQVLIIRNVTFGGVLSGVQILVYPMIFLLLPLRTPTVAMLLLAFFSGLVVDMFYNSPGVHAGACVFMAYARSFVLDVLQPREGYNIKHNPTLYHLGSEWFLLYSGSLMLLFFLFYFSVEAFTFVNGLRIFQRAFFSFLLSMPLIYAYQIIFNPK